MSLFLEFSILQELLSYTVIEECHNLTSGTGSVGRGGRSQCAAGGTVVDYPGH